MKTFKVIPLALALTTIGLLTGCFDKSKEIKAEVQQEIKTIENKSEAPNTTEVVPTQSQEATIAIEDTGIAITPQELPSDFFAPLVENTDYLKVAIDPSKNLVPASYNKPVIIDFFWYGCGHCNAMRPLMNPVIKNNPDVLAVKYPAAFPNWESGTKLYFAYKTMGILDKMHDITFDTLHTQHRNLLGNTEQLNKFLEEQGVDLPKFHSAENSFQMSRDLLKAKEVTAQYKLQSTPNMGVYYKGYAYLVNPGLSKGYENTAKSVQLMISKFTPEQIQGK